MRELLEKLRLLSHAELTLLKVRLRTLAMQVVLATVAVVLILMALGMVDISLYFALAKRMDRSLAALIVAALNALIAAGLLAAAKSRTSKTQTLLAREVRNMAWNSVQSDAVAVQERLRRFGSGSFGQNASRGLWGLVVPLLDFALGYFKRSGND